MIIWTYKFLELTIVPAVQGAALVLAAVPLLRVTGSIFGMVRVVIWELKGPVESSLEERLLLDRNVSTTALPMARGTNPIVLKTELAISSDVVLVTGVAIGVDDDDNRFSCEANMV